MIKEDRQPLKNDRVCGNCRYHNSYNYPDKIFCFAKFQKRETPVVSILDSCQEWTVKTQECNCLEDALKKHEKRSKTIIKNIKKS